MEYLPQLILRLFYGVLTWVPERPTQVNSVSTHMVVENASIASPAAGLSAALALTVHGALKGCGPVATLTAHAATMQRELEFLKTGLYREPDLP